MNLINRAIELEKGRYLVIEQVEFDGKKYLYLVNSKDESDSIFREIIEENRLELKKIDSELFRDIVYPLFLDKFSKYQ